MKTTLPTSINTLEEAKAFLTELHKNGESFHPEDDALDIMWDGLPEEQRPTRNECIKLNDLVEQIYACTNFEEFDPCEFILHLQFSEDEEV